MGDGGLKPPGNRNCHEHAVEPHPQSTSSTLTPKLHGRVRGLGAFPAHTMVARTIASLNKACGIEPPGCANATSAVNTGGLFIYGVQGYSCGHVATSVHN